MEKCTNVQTMFMYNYSCLGKIFVTFHTDFLKQCYVAILRFWGWQLCLFYATLKKRLLVNFQYFGNSYGNFCVFGG